MNRMEASWNWTQNRWVNVQHHTHWDNVTATEPENNWNITCSNINAIVFFHAVYTTKLQVYVTSVKLHSVERILHQRQKVVQIGINQQCYQLLISKQLPNTTTTISVNVPGSRFTWKKWPLKRCVCVCARFSKLPKLNLGLRFFYL